jgi:hypothetical protein
MWFGSEIKFTRQTSSMEYSQKLHLQQICIMQLIFIYNFDVIRLKQLRKVVYKHSINPYTCQAGVISYTSVQVSNIMQPLLRLGLSKAVEIECAILETVWYLLYPIKQFCSILIPLGLIALFGPWSPLFHMVSGPLFKQDVRLLESEIRSSV